MLSPHRSIIFRADASIQIGTGHVMRCLTLADALAAEGAACGFICRAHPGNLIDLIRSKGHIVHVLPVVDTIIRDGCLDMSDPGEYAANLIHSDWLGASQALDAEACALILAAQSPDWLIVDHYALDARWERALTLHYRKLMVIDDLADRYHACDLLLDQTFCRDEADYLSLVPPDCRLMCGSQYALLRPEFSALRPYSLERRKHPALRNLLVSMGGVDKDNVTGQVLQELSFCRLPADSKITVIMGATAPWLGDVRLQAKVMPQPTTVLVGVSNMAKLMADSDLAIGAAGATSWERCCLGLPTIMLPLAVNQAQSCRRLSEVRAGLMISEVKKLGEQLPLILRKLAHELKILSEIAVSSASITDGSGVGRVIQTIHDIKS